jgi:hypothetical protein
LKQIRDLRRKNEGVRSGARIELDQLAKDCRSGVPSTPKQLGRRQIGACPRPLRISESERRLLLQTLAQQGGGGGVLQGLIGPDALPKEVTRRLCRQR